MAADIARGFHDQLMAQERERVALRIANGTKASSPQIVSHRRQNPEYTGAKGGAVGSFNRPFFANKDESEKQLTGGVLRNFQYAQHILGQRAKDDLERQAAAEGIPEAARPGGEPPILDERESRELELNQLLQSIQDEIEIGDIGSIVLSDIKQIPRLLIALVPGFTQEELARLRRFVSDMKQDIDVEVLRAEGDAPEADKNQANRLAAFLERLLVYIKYVEADVGKSVKERALSAKQIAKQIFDPKKLFIKEAAQAVNLVRVQDQYLRRPRPGVYNEKIVESKPELPKPIKSSVKPLQQAEAILNKAARAGRSEIDRIAALLGVPIDEELTVAGQKAAIKQVLLQKPQREIRQLFGLNE